MKCFFYELSGDLYDQASRPIRKKEDILNLLVSTIKVLVSLPNTNENYCKYSNKLILYIDKMSRLFFCMESKIFSINFPFYASYSETSEVLEIRCKGIEIDNYISSLIISIFADSESFTVPLDNIQEFVLQHMADNSWDDVEIDDVCYIIKKLIMFETGYFRFDHDKTHANGRLHPENHIDFYYESSNEVKIGLKDLVDYQWMMNFTNINTDCAFLE